MDAWTLSQSLAEAVKAGATAVAQIRGHRRHVTSGSVFAPDLVVTANHGVRRDRGVLVGLPDGTAVEADVIGRHAATDLAVLRLPAPVEAPEWHDGDDLAVGHLVLPLGRPLGEVRAALGLLGQLGGPWRTALGGQIDRYLYVDGTLPRGFSGGPLVDARGRVLGVNTRELVPGGTTLPTATVRRVVQHLLDRGHTGERGYLGVGVQPVELPEGLVEATGQRAGLLIVSVAAGSPADGALHLGDAIVAVDGVSAHRVRDLLATLADKGPGGQIALKVVRAGAVADIAVTLGTR